MKYSIKDARYYIRTNFVGFGESEEQYEFLANLWSIRSSGQMLTVTFEADPAISAMLQIVDVYHWQHKENRYRDQVTALVVAPSRIMAEALEAAFHLAKPDWNHITFDTYDNLFASLKSGINPYKYTYIVYNQPTAHRHYSQFRRLFNYFRPRFQWAIEDSASNANAIFPFFGYALDKRGKKMPLAPAGPDYMLLDSSVKDGVRSRNYAISYLWNSGNPIGWFKGGGNVRGRAMRLISPEQQAAITGNVPPPLPDGYLSFNEMYKQYGFSHRQTHALCKQYGITPQRWKRPDATGGGNETLGLSPSEVHTIVTARKTQMQPYIAPEGYVSIKQLAKTHGIPYSTFLTYLRRQEKLAHLPKYVGANNNHLALYLPPEYVPEVLAWIAKFKPRPLRRKSV